MSFVRIGNLIINLMALTTAQFDDTRPGEPLLRITLIGEPEVIEFSREDAKHVWEALVKASASLQTFRGV